MSVNLNGFGFTIISDDVTHFTRQNGKHNYFSLRNLSEYKIKLINNRKTRSDANVSIDGESIGTWRIPSFSSIIIQRPANVNRKLIFIKENSYTAKYTDISQNDYNNGLVTVVFTPELECIFQYKRLTGFIRSPTFFDERNDNNRVKYGYDLVGGVRRQSGDSYSTNSSQLYSNMHNFSLKSDTSGYKLGATILGGGTDQHFTASSKIYKYDKNNITTINARIVITPLEI